MEDGELRKNRDVREFQALKIIIQEDLWRFFKHTDKKIKKLSPK